jgi:hypothetical protein
MAAANVSAVANADVVGTELEKVQTKVEMLYELDDMFYAWIKKRPVEQISNRQMRIPLEMNPGGSFQYFGPDGQDLGRGSGPTWDKAVVSAVFMSENMEYTKLAQWGTDSSRKAVQNAVRTMVARSLEEFRRQIDAQLMQSGNGAIGTITSVSTPSVGVDQYVCTTDGFGVRLMRTKQQIQVFDSTLTTLKGSGYITVWDVEGSTVQVTPAIAGAATGDRIVTYGISTPTALPALYGVPYHNSNSSAGVWLGFDRGSTPEVRASRVNAGGSSLTLSFPRLGINKIGNRVGISNKFNPTAWMHPGQKQAYEEIGQLVSIIQKKPSEEALDMYFDKMQMAGAAVKEHFNWDKTRIDLISDRVWGRAEILPIGFYTTDGRKYFEIRGASGGVATADIFYMVNGFQVYVNNPAGCSYIDNLAVPSGY